MKDLFQSKAVPRGTRTIWRYLSALILFFALSIGQMWGAVTTEVYDASGASNNTDMTKTGSTLAGTYVAGAGGGNIKNYSPNNKGVKLRTKQATVTVGETTYGYAVVTANSGYALKSFKLEGTSNDGTKTIPLHGVYVDIDVSSASNMATSIAAATNQLSSSVVFPDNGTNYVGTSTLSINATSNIVMLFDNGSDYNNQMRAIITVGYEATGETPTKSSAKKLLSLKFDNGFDAFINESAHTVTAYYLSGSSAPSVASHTESEKASYAISGNTITITAEDETTQDYTLTLTAVEPYAGTGAVESFTGSETYIKTGYTYSSGCWRFQKNADDGRIQEGKTRLYFFVGACQELKLTSGGDSRNMKVYRNGTELSTPTASGSNGTTITIAGSDGPAIYGLVSNQTSGDAKFNAIQIVPIPTGPVDPTATFSNSDYTIGETLDLSTLFESDSEGEVTYSITDAGETGAALANDGKTFSATAVGTATVKASQAATSAYNAVEKTATITVKAAPAEKDGIKMIANGALTGDFRIKADQLKSLSGTDKYTIDGLDYTKYVQMGSTQSSFGGETEGNQTKGIYYAPAKKNIRFWFYMRNTDTSNRKIYVYTVEEGESIKSTTVSVTAGQSELKYCDISLNKNAEIVFGVENTKLYFCQIVAVETGDALLQGGEVGYVFDYSKKRQNIAANTLRTIDHVDYYLSAESKINSGSNVQLTTLGTHYIKFHLNARTKVSIECDNKPYKIGTSKSGETAQIYSGQDDGAFNLTEGDWYINGAGETVKITKLSFLTPDAAYAVTYAAGKFGTTDATVKSGKNLPTHDEAVKDEKIILASGDDLECVGADFAGWKANGTGDLLQPGDEYTMTAAAVEFVAQWTEHIAKYGVKFMDGTTKLDSLSVTLGEAPIFANPKKALYSFAGWKDGEGNDVTLNNLATSVTKEDSVVVLYAQWTKAYASTVNFADDDNSGSLADFLPAGYACGGTFSSSTWGKESEGDIYFGYKLKDKNVYVEFRIAANQRATILFGNYGATGTIKVGDADAVECTLTDSKYIVDAEAEKVIRFTTNTGSGSTVTLKSITIGDIPAKSDDATLSDLKVGGTTVAGFAASKLDYYVELPYGSTSQPEVTATKHDTKASVVVSQTLASLDDAVVTVTAEDLSYKTYTVHFTVAPKLGVEVFAYTPVGSNGEKEATGYKGGVADINLQTAKTGDGYKLGSKGHYIGIIVDGGLKANDLICINIADLQGASALTFYDGKGDGKSLVITPAPTPKLGNNYVTVPSDIDQIYLYRADGTCNPSVKSVAVYRAMPSFFESFTVAGVAATIDETASPKTITVEVPAVTEITALTPTYKAWANGGATVSPTTAQDFSAGAIDYIVTSAYEETTTYKVTVTKAAAIKEVVISGTLTVKEDETTALSAVVYDTNDQEASIQDVTWSVKSGDEDLASIDANGVVTGKAVGTAHIIATSVADNSKFAQVEVVVTENPCRTWNAPTSSWSTAVVTVGKLQIARGDCPASSEMTPYSGASKCYGIKVDGSDKFIELTMSDGAQFESLTLGASSGSNGSSPKYVVVASSATTFASSAVLSAVEYVANAKDAEQSLNVIDLPTGTRNVRLYRSYESKGDGTSIFLYYVAACKKEFVPVTAVAVADANMAIGKSMTLSATTTPANADIESFVWSIKSMTATGVTLEGNVLTAADNATEGNVVVKVVATDVLNNEVEATATISIVNKFEKVKPVTGATTWDWEPVSVLENGPTIAAPDTVLANYISGEIWEMLAGGNGDRPYRGTSYKAFQGKTLYFETTVPGKLKMYAGRISNDQKVYVNGIEVGKVTSTKGYLNEIVVPAGKVYITAGTNGMRIYNMTFDPNLDPEDADYKRPVNAGRYGTICLPNGGVMTGATLYEIAYYEASSKKIFFDEILNGTMEAGVPYIFLPNENATQLGVFYTDAANEEAKSANGLVGYINGEEEDEEHALAVPAGVGNYILMNNQYREVVNENTGFIVSHRAYIKLASVPNDADAPAPGRRRIAMGVQGSQVATGMDALNAGETPVKVLINGQMYILRGEKMYDATGKLVK